MTFDEAYKDWRNRARRYDPQSVVYEALRYLGESTFPGMHEEVLKGAPWQTLLLVKWVCQDRYLDGRRAAAVTRQDFEMLRQRLWELPDQLERDHGGKLPLRLFVRQLMRPQLGFQRRITRSFVREAILLSEQGYDHALCRLFRELTGLDVLDFIDLSLAAFAGIADGDRTIRDEFFDGLLETYPKNVISSFRSALSCTYPELIAFSRSLPDARKKVTSELFEFPVLSRFPFFRTGNAMTCWHPSIFFRGLEGFVHSVLSEAGPDYIIRFSRLFERHIVSEAKSMPARFLSEDELSALIGSETKVPDGLLSFPDCNVFVEAKAGLFSESVMTAGNREIFARKTRAVRFAVWQAWATSSSLRTEGRAPTNVLKAPKDYLLIVTNKELGVSSGRSFAEIYPNDTLEYPSPLAKQFLPLRRIYVLCVEDFERLASAARNDEIYLPDFLASCVKDDDKSATSLMLFEQHLNRRNVPMRFSKPIETAVDASTARLEAAIRAKI